MGKRPDVLIAEYAVLLQSHEQSDLCSKSVEMLFELWSGFGGGVAHSSHAKTKKVYENILEENRCITRTFSACYFNLGSCEHFRSSSRMWRTLLNLNVPSHYVATSDGTFSFP